MGSRSVWSGIRSRSAVRKRQIDAAVNIKKEGVKEYVSKRKRSRKVAVSGQE